MKEVDRIMVEDLGVELVQMMESAGRHLAHLARSLFVNGDAVGKRVVVLAGSGGNGGGAMAAARRHGWGADVAVFLARQPAAIAGAAERQLAILERMDVAVTAAPPPRTNTDTAVILDGILSFRNCRAHRRMRCAITIALGCSRPAGGAPAGIGCTSPPPSTGSRSSAAHSHSASASPRFVTSFACQQPVHRAGM